jgi:Domain of unknown function (DUF397)
MTMIRDGKFRKASGSETGNCVEVAATPASGVLVRDSKDQEGPVLSFEDAIWLAFVASVRAGRYDVPS